MSSPSAYISHPHLYSSVASLPSINGHEASEQRRQSSQRCTTSTPPAARYRPQVLSTHHDLIWSSLDADELDEIQLVCKDWKWRTDLRRSSHIVVELKDNSKVRIRARSFDHETTLDITGEANDCHDAQQLGTHNESNCRFCIRLGRETIVDLVGCNPDTIDTEDRPFNLMWPEITMRTLDNLPDSEGGWELPEICNNWVFFLEHRDTERPEFCLDFAGGSYDSPTLVFNLDSFSDPTATSFQFFINITSWQEPRDSSGNLVFVFHNKTTRSNKQPRRDPTFIAGLLNFYPLAGICITFVGLDEFIKPGRYMDEFIDAVCEAHTQHCSDVYDYPPGEVDRESFDELVRFLSHDEYEEEIGERDYMAHTVR